MLKVVGASWMQIRISTWIIGAVIALGIIAIILGETGHLEEDGNYSATAYWNKESGFEIKFWGQGMRQEKIPLGVSRAYYRPHLNTTGWAILDIETESDYPDWVQAYAAGMLEGSLSWQMIHWHWQNTVKDACLDRQDFCLFLKSYFEENLNWVKAKGLITNEPYWHQINLFYLQLEGLKQGFELGVKRSRQDIEPIELIDFIWMNSVSDVTDLEFKLNATEVWRQSRTGFDCGFEGFTLASAFIRLVEKEARLYVAHNSAGSYASMLKMFKHYHFGYHISLNKSDLVPGKKVSFSSYPGAIHSMDDFYVIWNDNDKKLVITGTPITMFNDRIWQNVSPINQVLIGPRVAAANRLATDAKSWSEILVKFNSGTGNKEWAVVDVGRFEEIAKNVVRNHSKFVREYSNAKDLLWVVEQIPGGSAMADQTSVLKNFTYWASYGIPYYQNISEASGNTRMYLEYGDAFSYERTALAQIFKRDSEKATDFESISRLMRSNSYKKDPFSYGNPRCAVGSRGDVRSDTIVPKPVGVTDAKIFSTKDFSLQYPISNNTFKVQAKMLAKARQSPQEKDESLRVISGPAYSVTDEDDTDDDLQPFNWIKSEFSQVSHAGHPDDWNFKSISLF